MAHAMEDVLAVPGQAGGQAGSVSMKQLRHWERTGLVAPSIKRELSPRNTVRLYTFQDLLELLVAAELRHRPGISLQHIRRLVGHLRSRGFSAPLRELRFATHGHDIYVQYPEGTWSGDPHLDQLVFHQVIALDLLAGRIEALSHRDPRIAGRVVRRRGSTAAVRSSKGPAFPSRQSSIT